MRLEEELYAVFIGLREMIYIVIILAALVLIVFILFIVEKRLSKKLQMKQESKDYVYMNKLKELKESKKKPEESLDAINTLSRDFFKDVFQIPYSWEYSELITEFRKRGQKECISFCDLISDLNYSGEKIEESKIKTLSNLLEKIIEKNKILSEEEKKELEAKKQEEEKPEEVKEGLLSKMIKPFKSKPAEEQGKPAEEQPEEKPVEKKVVKKVVKKPIEKKPVKKVVKKEPVEVVEEVVEEPVKPAKKVVKKPIEKKPVKKVVKKVKKESEKKSTKVVKRTVKKPVRKIIKGQPVEVVEVIEEVVEA